VSEPHGQIRGTIDNGGMAEWLKAAVLKGEKATSLSDRKFN